MALLGAEINWPMAVARSVHFAAAATATGALLFRALVAEPTLHLQPKAGLLAQVQTRWLAWTGLCLMVISGLIWVALLTESLSDEGLVEAFISGALRDVLTLTQFGVVTQVRLILAVALAICLTFDRSMRMRWLGLGIALCLMASIAWTGHAASTPHALGYLHLGADALHLCAAAAWIGGLLPLALLFRAGGRLDRSARIPVEFEAARRFSTLGIASVAALILSGIINAWILVGSFRGLIDTDYGWILLAKLAVFAIMLAFAAINRLYLTPRLTASQQSDLQRGALKWLTRISLIEITLGLIIFAMVGVLGMMHPAIHLVKQD